jgi:hypothetical protein
MLREYHKKYNIQSDACSTDDEDDGEVQRKLSQMNLTNWLKSWGREIDKQDITKQSIQSKGDVQFSEQHS